MRFETTITARINGALLFETDVTVVVGYKIDRYSELTWWVDQYLVEDRKKNAIIVPANLASIFDIYLDREKIEERLREALIEADEMKRDEGDAEHAAAYRASEL